MRILRKHRATLVRHLGTGFWDEDGNWSEGGVEESIIPCSIQPAFRSGIYQKTLPEGIHQKDCRTIHTTTKLIVGSEKEQINSDYLIINNLEYEIYEAQEWWGVKNLSHYEALLIRRDKLNAST